MSTSAHKEELLAEAQPKEYCRAHSISMVYSTSSSISTIDDGDHAHTNASAQLEIEAHALKEGVQQAESRHSDAPNWLEKSLTQGRAHSQRVDSHVQQRLSIAQRTTSVAKLKRLYQLLQRLNIENRRAVLMRSFLQEQRIALERWILEHRDPGDIVPKRRASNSLQKATSKKRCQQKKMQLSVVHSLPSTSQLRARGITLHRRKQGNFYSALVLFERLELRTREVPALHVASIHLKVLREIKECLSEEMCKLSLRPEIDVNKASETLQEMMLSVISQVCASRGIDVDHDLGLYFRVNAPARRWIGASLCGPVFRLRKDLQQGLHGWSLIQAASHVARSSQLWTHAGSWEQLRKAYLTIWTLAGRDPAKIRKIADHLDVLHERSSRSRQATVRRSTLDERSEVIAVAVVKKQLCQQRRELARSARTERRAHRIEAQIRNIVCQWTARFIKALARATKVTAAKTKRREEKLRAAR